MKNLSQFRVFWSGHYSLFLCQISITVLASAGNPIRPLCAVCYFSSPASYTTPPHPPPPLLLHQSESFPRFLYFAQDIKSGHPPLKHWRQWWPNSKWRVFNQVYETFSLNNLSKNLLKHWTHLTDSWEKCACIVWRKKAGIAKKGVGGKGSDHVSLQKDDKPSENTDILFPSKRRKSHFYALLSSSVPGLGDEGWGAVGALS